MIQKSPAATGPIRKDLSSSIISQDKAFVKQDRMRQEKQTQNGANNTQNGSQGHTKDGFDDGIHF